ncbi:serine/threonine-protein kinase [Saccharomonospora xinjiangensis]|uniref:serine/threonine-protein kinase n=1 Tax=Saccharomonospora xinjiangensis TaxID=75294 RepID=UPI00350EAC78
MASRQAGDVVGSRYRLVSELGSGGFGRVWRAHDETLDVHVAIKELRLAAEMSEAEHADRLARATREARNAARLREHDNIVTIHDVVVEDGLPWIVMELVDGPSLIEHLDENGPLSVDEAADVAAALLTAIGAAHREGVVHRDIKPGNVLLAGNGKTLLTDFGIAVHDTDPALTATGMLVGSVEYAAPERLRGTEVPAGDLFSLGATLYQAVEGFSPFRRDSHTATLTAVLFDEPPPPRRAGRLTPLISRLLEKDPAKRPTVAEARALIDQRTVTRGQTRGDTRLLPRRSAAITWHTRAIAALMTIITVLGFAGLPDAGDTWEHFENYKDNSVAEFLRVAVALANVAVVGLLCSGASRFVRQSAGRIGAAAVRVTGFVFGCGAAVFAFHGAAQTFGNLSERDSATMSLVLISFVNLVAIVLALRHRRSRTH